MKTTNDFIEEIKSNKSISSDYAVAKLLGISKQSMTNYTRHGRTFDDDIAKKVAEILGYDPAFIFTCMHAQRAKNPEVKKVWEEMAQRLGGAAAALVFTLPALHERIFCILCSIRRIPDRRRFSLNY